VEIAGFSNIGKSALLRLLAQQDVWVQALRSRKPSPSVLRRVTIQAGSVGTRIFMIRVARLPFSRHNLAHMSHSNALTQTIETLTKVPYFSDLNSDILTAIAQVAERLRYDRDQIVFIEGDPGVGLYVVEGGWFKIVKMSLDGREQVIHFLGTGEAFNAMSVFTEAPNPATVIALESSSALLVRREAMVRLLDAHPRLARVMIQKLAARVQHLITLVEDLSLRTVEARMARMLLAGDHQGEGQTVSRRRWATQNEMAARLGTVPDVVSRTLRKLASEGLIEVARHQIKILDVKGLERVARLE
jgi:CRP/FNR family transcriptional regulator